MVSHHLTEMFSKGNAGVIDRTHLEVHEGSHYTFNYSISRDTQEKEW